MSKKPTIKPTNHIVYQCPSDKKIDLLNKLIKDNDSLKTMVVVSSDADSIKTLLQNQDIEVYNDKEFVLSKDLKCELLISFDIPIKDIVYEARLTKSTKKAFLLLDKSEQKALYPIERLLGRVIKQESVAGFEYEVELEEKKVQRRDTKPFSKSFSKPFQKSFKQDKSKDKNSKWAKKKGRTIVVESLKK